MSRALRGLVLSTAVALAVAAPAVGFAQTGTPAAPGQQGHTVPLPDPAGFASGELDPEIQSLIEEAERTRPVPNELLNELAMGRGDATQMINEFLAEGNATPREVAVRAVALSLAVGRDPRLKDSDRRFSLNQTISDGMSKSLGAPRILNVEVDADFVPPEGTFAWDLGGLTTPVADGFQQLTPYSAEVGGPGLRDLDEVGDGPALQDVIENLQNLTLQVPNGQYRVILLTAEQLAARSSAPFGETFKVNGVEYVLGKSSSGDWFDTAFLRGAGDAVLDNVKYGAAGLSVVVEVGNGTLSLEFSGGRGSLGSILSGIVMEPIALPSRLDTSAVRGKRNAATRQGSQQRPAQQAARPAQPLMQSLNLDQVIELEFRTQAAIAVVSGIAPAAGPNVATLPATPTPPRPTTPTRPAPPPPFNSGSGVSPSS